MKKVIDGKMFNTETATNIAEYSYGYDGDFDSVFEELYVTKKGSLFLYGIGGPMSKYGRSLGQNQYGGGSEIIPMTRKEAFEWCQDND